jgi:hypothetical protein
VRGRVENRRVLKIEAVEVHAAALFGLVRQRDTTLLHTQIPRQKRGAALLCRRTLNSHVARYRQVATRSSQRLADSPCCATQPSGTPEDAGKLRTGSCAWGGSSRRRSSWRRGGRQSNFHRWNPNCRQNTVVRLIRQNRPGKTGCCCCSRAFAAVPDELL